jgi:RNA polymerase sigma-70 factor (ECF subfamily)
MSLAASFDRLVAEHQRSVLRISRSILRDEHLGADAAQETFVRLWRSLEAGRAPENSGGWLQRVAVTAALDLRRRRRSRAARERQLAGEPGPSDHARARLEAGEPAFESREQPERAVHERELEERFERALATLSEGQRTIFLLRHSGGLTLAEIAETLDIALPTAKTQFARACLRLQAALRPFRPGTEEPS